MSFYKFYQNNSGGSLDKNLPHLLFVEADSAHEANGRATDIGVYFNGVEDEMDCSRSGASKWEALP